jgi:hypothetical protein
MNHTSVGEYIVYNLAARSVPEPLYVLKWTKQRAFQLVLGIDFSGNFTKAGRARPKCVHRIVSGPQIIVYLLP